MATPSSWFSRKSREQHSILLTALDTALNTSKSPPSWPYLGRPWGSRPQQPLTFPVQRGMTAGTSSGCT